MAFEVGCSPKYAETLFGAGPVRVTQVQAGAAVEHDVGGTLVVEEMAVAPVVSPPMLELGVGVLVVPVGKSALTAALRRYEGFSARLLVPYYVWVLYDLAWTYALWRLNGAG